MRIRLAILISFLNVALFAQRPMELVFFGEKYSLDSSRQYKDEFGNPQTRPLMHGRTVMFKGVMHVEHYRRIMEDPINPAHFRIVDESQCTDTVKSNNAIDTIRFNRLSRDSSFYVYLNGKKFPITSCMIQGDSTRSPIGAAVPFSNYDDVAWENTYARNYMGNFIWNQILLFDKSTQFLVTEIRYFDYTINRSVELDLSLYILK